MQARRLQRELAIRALADEGFGEALFPVRGQGDDRAGAAAVEMRSCTAGGRGACGRAR